MKCPQCDGYGKVTYIVRSGNRIISKEVGECDYCYGTGEVNDWETESTEEPMTNEEYLKSCNTEQFATFLAIVQYDGTDLTLKKSHVEKWVEWLKEKHE